MTPKSVSTSYLPTYMLSQPPPSEQTLPRRPASVTSRSATNNRRHRTSRSHNGGSSFRPQNEFPNFASTGDVEIIVNADGQERRYMLHRLILSQCSGFFEAGTSEDWSRAQAQGHSPATASTLDFGSRLSRIGEEEDEGDLETLTIPTSPPQGKCRWRYELDWGHQDDEVPMLVQRVCLHFSLILFWCGMQLLRSRAAPSVHNLRWRSDSSATCRPYQTTFKLKLLFPKHDQQICHAICCAYPPSVT